MKESAIGTCIITQIGFLVHDAEATAKAYAELFGVWRTSGAYYLYAAPARAFILPDGQCALSPAELYDLFRERLPGGALHGRRP